MSEIHLSPERWRALLEGRLEPAERAALQAHLETDCETCEAALAEAALEGETDGLDGEVDAALLEARGEAWPVDELAGRRLRRTLEGPSRRFLGLAGAGAVTAAAAVFLILFVPTPEGPGDGVRLKGGDEKSLPRLDLARVGVDGALDAVPSGGTVARTGHLLLRFDSPRAGLCGALRVKSGGQTLLDRPGHCPPAGSSTLADGGEVVAIALEDPSLGEDLAVSFETEEGARTEVSVRLSSSE